MNSLLPINEHKWKIIFDQGFLWDNIIICYCDVCGLVKKEEGSKIIYYFSKIHGTQEIPNSNCCIKDK